MPERARERGPRPSRRLPGGSVETYLTGTRVADGLRGNPQKSDVSEPSRRDRFGSVPTRKVAAIDERVGLRRGAGVWDPGIDHRFNGRGARVGLGSAGIRWGTVVSLEWTHGR